MHTNQFILAQYCLDVQRVQQYKRILRYYIASEAQHFDTRQQMLLLTVKDLSGTTIFLYCKTFCK